MTREAIISFGKYRRARVDVFIDCPVFRVENPPEPVSGAFLGSPITLSEFPLTCHLRLVGVAANYDCVRTGTENKFTLTRIS
jgi:hypothetical protein